MKPTPVIKFIAWIYLLLGMENFFWAAFRYFQEGVNGFWTRVFLSSVLGIAFFSYALWLSKQQLPKPDERSKFWMTPVTFAWMLAFTCLLLQYYRFFIWNEWHQTYYGIRASPDTAVTIAAMHETWISFITAFILTQSYGCLPDSFKIIPKIIPGETVEFSRNFTIVVIVLLLSFVLGLLVWINQQPDDDIGDSYSVGYTNVIKKMQIRSDPEYESTK
ncbi:MAG: hypothetical protein AB7S78_01340 [Candidatus Omnitrophota bacterium]